MEIEQELQDVEHFATIIAGCENMNFVMAHGGTLSYEGQYAQSVLRLHAQDDLGAFAGNESIGASIKAGAAAVVKWIKEFIKSIVTALENFGASFKSNKFKQSAKQMASKAVKEDLAEEYKKIHQGYADGIKNAQTTADTIHSINSEATDHQGQIKTLITSLSALHKAAESASDDYPDKLQATGQLIGNITRSLNSKLESYVSKEGKKDKEVTNGTMAIKGCVNILAIMNRLSNQFIKDAGNMYDKTVAASKNSANADKEAAKDKK